MKKIYLILIIIFAIIFVSYFVYFLIISNYNYKKEVLDQNAITFRNLQKGDLLFRRTAFFDFTLPGFWTHVAFFIGFDENNMGYVAEAGPLGIRKVDLNYYSKKGPVYVKKVKNLDESKINFLENWYKSKFGNKFTWYAFSKIIDKNEYYCSEFVWAGFMKINIDLDSETFANFTVTPQEIYDSNYLESVGILKLDQQV